MKKYELTAETMSIGSTTLHRIRALVDFNDVKAGDLGGWIEKESNLNQDGRAWVYGNAMVYGDARVCGDARISNNEGILWISKIGSRNDTVTFFVTEGGGIGVVCGCFSGTLEEFAAAVEKTHGDNEHGQAYRLAIELAKLRIKLPEDERTERSHA